MAGWAAAAFHAGVGRQCGDCAGVSRIGRGAGLPAAPARPPLPAQPGYPDVIQALNLGGVELHRVRSPSGAARFRRMARRAVAQAHVSVLCIASFDYIDETSPSTIGAIAAVAPGLGASATALGLQARVWQLLLQPQRSALLDDALPGARRIRVSSGVPFAPGSATDVIAIAGLGTRRKFSMSMRLRRR